MKRSLLLIAMLAGCASSTPAPEPEPMETASTTSDPNYPAGEPTSAEEAWRAQPPEPGAAPELKLPVFERAKLKNGLTVLTAEVRALPLVSFILVTRGGSATDPKGQGGLTTLAYDLIGEGAAGKSALEFTNAVADLGASFGTGADQDKGTISISGLTRNADAMLGLLADATMRPNLRKADFARVKQQTLGALVRRKGSAQGLAFEVVPGVLYGESHPYGHPTVGTEETVKKLSLKGAKRHLKRTLVPSASALIAVGDIDLATATKMAEAAFGKWKGKRAKAPKYAAVKPTKRGDVLIVHKANSPQTMVVIGRPIFGTGSSDDVPLRVTNEVYGGSFAARLNMNLREAKGYTYGAHSVLSTRHGVGAFLAYSKIRADVTAPGLAEFFNEMRGMLAKPASDPELDRAKNGMIRSLPGDFELTGAAAGAATSLFVYDLPLDHYARRPKAVAAVGHDELKAMSERYLTPDSMRIILVGDADQIAKPVEALGLGTTVIRGR